MIEDVIILKSDGTPLKRCSRTKAEWMLRLGVARLYQAEGPMKIILKAPTGIESEADILERVRVKHPPVDKREAGDQIEKTVQLLAANGQLERHITPDTAKWLLKTGIARVYRESPYTLILKSSPDAAQAVLPSGEPNGLTSGDRRIVGQPHQRLRLYPFKLLWPHYTPTKETV